jgi:PPP family 3-phenylpropionic acid transporter
MSLYLLHLGYPGWQIGVLVGMQPGLRWCGGIAWAYAADRWRKRRQVLVATAVAGSVCFLPLLVVTRFGEMAVVLTAIGLLHGPLIPFVDATVIDNLDALGGDYGRVRLWGSVAFVIGALASAPLVHAFGPAVVPALLLAPQVALAPALARLPGAQLGHPESFRAPWRLVTPPIAALLATGFLLNASAGAWVGFFAVHTAGLGLSDALPGVAWGLAVTAEVVFLFFSRRLLAWLGPADLILLALATTAARWTATALAHGQLAVALVQLAQAFTFAAFHVAALGLLARLVPPESSTGGQALYGMVGFGIGGTVGITLAGLLVDRLGTSAVFGVEAVVAAAALAPALRLRRLLRR